MRPFCLSLLLFACGDTPVDTGKGSPAEDLDGDGYSSAEDCNDADSSVSPAGAELCDGIDNNCDGSVDEGVTQEWYPDDDGDGFGSDNEVLAACERPGGAVPNQGDCDDGSADNFPGAEETCDGVDNDCDGQLDPESCRPLATSDGVIICDMEGAQAGYDVAGVGDVNGDGVNDVALGLPTAESNAGAVWVYAGPIAGEHGSDDALALVHGAHIDDVAGHSLTGGADLTGDGLADLVVGVRGDTVGGASAGAISIYAGPLSGDYSSEVATARLIGESPGDTAGIAVAIAGDPNGDGWPDLLVGAPNEESFGVSSGVAYLVAGPLSGEMSLGTAEARLFGTAEGDYAGQRVAGLGDQDGDGLDDVALSLYGYDAVASGAGAVFIFQGPVLGDLSAEAADVAIHGEAAGDHAGVALDGPGDLNGDGYADLLIGSPDQATGGEGAGAAYVVSGPVSGDYFLSTTDSRLTGRRAWDHAGASIDGVGDADGDGWADILVGAYIEDSGGINAGAAYLVRGPFSGTRTLSEADAGFIGEAEGDLAGWSVAGVGDSDGDGLGDLMIGAPSSDRGADNGGVVYIISSGGF